MGSDAKLITLQGLKTYNQMVGARIPSKTSQLTNDSSFVCQSEIDLSQFLTNDEFHNYEPIIEGAVNKKSLATINGQSLVNGGKDIVIDALFEQVDSLPTSGQSKNKIYIMLETENGTQVANQYIWNGSSWTKLGPASSKVELSKYLTIDEADKKYMIKSGSSTGGSTASGGASLSISTQGSFNNYGNNGQAFNAVRDLSLITDAKSKDKWKTVVGSGFPLNAASFGVKDTGATAFSHKKYNTFNSSTGAYTGAKNTAVLVFSGKSGLLYAKNTGTAIDVTDAMYKYVGVIDSPDEQQRVYSASQTDGITNALAQRISDLEGQNEYLMNVIALLIAKTGVTDQELADASNGIIARQSLSDINDDVTTNIQNKTTDYSGFSNEESHDIV